MNRNTATCAKELHYEVEQFLFMEAQLLDEGRFSEWLNLLTDDIRYWMPSMSRKYKSISASITIPDANHYEEREYTTENELSILDETKDSLTKRIARLATGMAWAEDPPSCTCHVISNILIRDWINPSEISVYSNFIMYRTRSEHEENFFIGRRDDVLRTSPDGWRIAARKILIPQNVLSAKNASNFF